MMEESKIFQRKDSESFHIKIEHTQNGTWQGKVTWIDGNKEQYFRSALELFQLMDSVINPEEQRGPEE